ncbi:MAG: potassium channel protein [Myxococcales bacterium]|nr:potassium channel protein [Myxococcales bacterium]
MLHLSFRRVAFALLVLGSVTVGGGVLLWLATGQVYSLPDAVYFAVITVSTVGYGELPEMSPAARVVTSLLIIAGIGAIAFFQSTLTALLVEGAIGKAFRKRRMEKRIQALRDHYIVAGAGRTGRMVVGELVNSGVDFVVIDMDEHHIQRIEQEFDVSLLYVIGDATEDHSLLEAGIAHARGLVACLTNDPQNLFVTLSARSLNAQARIVSKVVEAENQPKMLKAGANTTVSPNHIGGVRLAGELVRPKLTRFLDETLRQQGAALRFDEVEMPGDSPFVNCTLSQIPIRQRTNLLVMALRMPDGSLSFNPLASEAIAAGTQLIVIGGPGDIATLREMLGVARQTIYG